MFTGIIEEVGTVRATAPSPGGRRMTFATALGGVKLGDSIAVNGCCLTATRVDGASFDADLSNETLERTTLGSLANGSRVNLERALAAGDRMGGHIVSGHVDGVGTVRSTRDDGETRIVTFGSPRALLPYIAEKGSVAVNGVSLTVNVVDDAGFAVTLVPFTLAHTTFGDAKAGDPVNLEVDVIARYVLRGLDAFKKGIS